MADIKGLNILMNMQDVGVGRTLKQIKGQFKTLSSEMNRSNRDFKESERSMATLKSRSRELNQGIKATENSMKDITAQLKKMTLEEQRTSEHAEKLRLEYSRQNKALNMYKRQLNVTENDMKQFGQSTKRTAFSMEKIDTVLGTLRKQLNITNMAFKNGGQSTRAYEQHLNGLNTVINKHQRTLQTMQARYRSVVKSQGAMSHETIDLKQKILQEERALAEVKGQYRQTAAAARRFAMEQKTATMSMSEIKNRINQVAQSLKISSNAFRMTGTTAQSYKAKIASLSNAMKEQKLIVQSLSRQYAHAKSQYGANSAEARELAVQLSDERVKLKGLHAELNQTTNAHKRLQMEQKQNVSSMSQLRASMSSLNDKLSLSRSNLSRAGESARAYKNHMDILKGSLASQRSILRDLNAQYKFVISTQGRESQEARELSSTINQQKIRMNELQSELRQTGVAYQQLAAKQRNAAALNATGFGRAIQSVDKYKESLRSVTGTMRSVGAGASMYMTMPAVAAMGGAVKASIDWEQALAGVAKTTNMSGGELKKMGNDITAMSNKMPFAATEIAGVAESAGQLGVKKQDINSFTKTMMNMGVATNLTADEAATEFARFANAANMPIKDVNKLGSTVVALGNSTATTEKEIVEMAQRLAGAGKQAGFSANEIMSISASMSSVGINAEAGGTAMTQVLNKMTKAVAGGGSQLDAFAKTSGVSAKEFAKTWDENPSKALQMFIKGLSQTKGGAKGVLAALDDVGIKGVREADTVRRMANNHQVLDKALKTGKTAWKENSALTNEAEIRYKTMGSKLKVLRNTFVNFLRTLGSAVAPAIIALSNVLTGLLKHLQKSSTFTKVLIAVFLGVAAVIPPLLISIGLLATGFTNVAEAAILLNRVGGGQGIMAGFRAGMKKALAPVRAMTLALRTQEVAAWASIGPYALIAGAVIALGAAFILAYKKSETFRNIVNAVINPVKNAVMALWDVMKRFGAGIKAVFSGDSTKGLSIFKKILPPEAAKQFTQTLNMIRNAYMQFVNFLKLTSQIIGAYFKAFWKENGSTIIGAFVAVKNAVGAVLGTLYNLIIKPILSAIRGAFIIVFGGLKQIVVNAFTAIRMVVQGALTVLSGMIKVFKGVFTGDWRLVWQGVKQVFRGAITGLVGTLRMMFGALVIVVKTLGKLIVAAFVGMWRLSVRRAIYIATTLLPQIRAIMTAVKNAVVRIFTKMAQASRVVWTAMKIAIIATARALVKGVRDVIGAIKRFVINVFTVTSKVVKAIWRGLKNAVIAYSKAWLKSFRVVFNLIKKVVTSTMKAARNIVVKLWRAFRNTVLSISRSMSKGIRNIFNGIKRLSISIWTSIKNKVIALAKNLWRNVRNIFNSMKRGINSIFSAIRKGIIRIWTTIRNKVVALAKSLWNNTRKIFNNMKNGLNNISNRIRSSIVRSWTTIRNKVVNIVKTLWNKVRGTFNNMKNGLASIIGKIKGHINGMVTSIKKGLNKLISGINWVGNKLGMGKQMIKPIQLSTGTANAKQYVTNGKINQDTMAVVGDKGRGNGRGGYRNETITYPNGKQVITPGTDTMAYLPKGSTVHSGAATQAAGIPKFAKGTMSAIGDLIGGGKKPKKVKAHDHNDVASDAKNKLAKTWGNVKSGFNKGFETSKGWAKAAGSQVMKMAGKVEDWVEHPGKVVNSVLDNFGFNFDFLKGGEIPYKLMKGMYKKLKQAAKKKILDMIEESSGGDGDGSYIKYLNNITTPYSPNGPPPGYAFSWPHPGIDLPYIYEKIRSTLNGKAYSKEMPGGFGHYILVKSGALEAIYGHLSKRFIKNGQHVKPGQVLGVSGNTGASTGPHLHYEMHKNGKPINPITWLKKHSGGGKSGKWSGDVKKALRLSGLPTSAAYVNAWKKQIQTESTGNPKALGGTDGLADGRAKGLVQVKPGTFNAYKLPGHGNIWNGLDNLIAGMRYAKARYGRGGMLRAIGHGHGYATGGLINSAGWYNIAEGGHPEWVIPTDPKHRNDAMKMLQLAAQDIQSGRNNASKNKRPNQLNTTNINQDSDDSGVINMLARQLEATQKQVELLTRLVASNERIEQQPKGFTERDVSKAQGRKAQMTAYNLGGAF